MMATQGGAMLLVSKSLAGGWGGVGGFKGIASLVREHVVACAFAFLVCSRAAGGDDEENEAGAGSCGQLL